jgi:hypothetical protein
MRSISSHFECKTSAVRAEVRIRSSSARSGVPERARRSTMNAATSPKGIVAKWVTLAIFFGGGRMAAR